MYASAQIDGREWLTAKQPITDRIEENERRVSRLIRTDALNGLAGKGEALAVEWPNLHVSMAVAPLRSGSARTSQ